MRASDLPKQFSHRVSVSLENVKDEDKAEVAGMLRGLKVAIEGYSSIEGLTNEKLTSSDSVIVSFDSPENAEYFKNCVDYYFSDEILAALSVKRRVYRR